MDTEVRFIRHLHKKQSEEEKSDYSGETRVFWSIVHSKAYRKKFNSISDNEAVNKRLFNLSEKIFKHRGSTENEDMYWIDAQTGEIVTEQLKTKVKRGITYSDKNKTKIEEGKPLITIHNHPHNMPPSYSDLRSNFENGYILGVVICHNAKIFVYSVHEMIEKKVYNTYYKLHKAEGCSEYECQYRTILDLKKHYAIDFKEVT